MARQTGGYNELMQELQVLLGDMQAEDLDVDEALRKYERGQILISELEKYLKVAENQIKQHKLKLGEEAE